ncbi:MAG: TIGR00725 family protein [Phycisphaerae bacterium]|nr:TIGR00725 family protein [Phycisphaerae bacterium]
MRKAIIGVMGGSHVPPAIEQQAEQLGRAIAAQGWILLNGGRNCGVMAASARGARAEGGTTIGILPGQNTDDAAPDVDIAIVTGMGDARNLVNVLSSTVVVAMPGGTGTASEVALALKNGKRVILLGFPDSPLFSAHRQAGQLTVANTVDEVIAQATATIEALRHEGV